MAPDLEAGQTESNEPSTLKKCVQLIGFLGKRLQSKDPAKDDPYGIVTRKLDECTDGYNQIATFQSSDPNFLLYRRFGYLHCRVLSSLQYDIERLEFELDKLDEWDAKKGDPNARLISQDKDRVYSKNTQFPRDFQLRFKQTRPEILTELRNKLLDYDELLLKTRDVNTLQRPPTKDYNSVKWWFMNHEPVVQAEWKYLRRKEDIVTLRTGQECASFDGFVERVLSYSSACLDKVHCRLIRKVFMTQSLREKTSDPNLTYFDPARLDALVSVIIMAIIFILLILPVVALYELSDIGKHASAFEAIGILIIFTLVFGMAMSILTNAKRHELFAASAAYCAVLVVFIGNFTTQTVVLAK